MKTVGKLFVLVVIGIILLGAFNSCETCIDGKGPVIIEDREIDVYSKLEIDVAADISITPGDDIFVRIHAEENLLPIIKTNVEGKTLVIKSRPCVNSDKTIKIELTVPKLTAIDINGSASVRFTELMNTEDFNISINGSGDFNGNVFANTVDANINGSGDILINGTTKNLDVEINGSGEFMGLGLKSFEADVTIRGSGDVDVNALNKLKAEVLGSGDIRYIGNPQISSSIQGSGQVSKKN